MHLSSATFRELAAISSCETIPPVTPPLHTQTKFFLQDASATVTKIMERVNLICFIVTIFYINDKNAI